MALLAGVALAWSVGAEAASTTPATTSTKTVTSTRTSTVTVPGPSTTVTETKTAAAPSHATSITNNTTTLPSGNKNDSGTDVPAWGWIVIGLGAVLLAIVMYLVGRGHRQPPAAGPEPYPPTPRRPPT